MRARGSGLDLDGRVGGDTIIHHGVVSLGVVKPRGHYFELHLTFIG